MWRLHVTSTHRGRESLITSGWSSDALDKRSRYRALSSTARVYFPTAPCRSSGVPLPILIGGWTRAETARKLLLPSDLPIAELWCSESCWSGRGSERRRGESGENGRGEGKRRREREGGEIEVHAVVEELMGKGSCKNRNTTTLKQNS